MTACASTPERVEILEQARADVQTLSQEPLASEAASRELAAARSSLNAAEQALKKGDLKDVNHYSYLASRQAQTGKSRVEAAEARQQVTQAEAERNRVLLEARTREAERATSQRRRPRRRLRQRRQPRRVRQHRQQRRRGRCRAPGRPGRPRRSCRHAEVSRGAAGQADGARHGADLERRAVRHRRRHARSPARISGARAGCRLHVGESGDAGDDRGAYGQPWLRRTTRISRNVERRP